MIPRNIFENIPAELTTELFETLVEGAGFKMERIVSRGQVSPEGFWYDQPQNEWVIVLQGHAYLVFEGKDEPVFMSAGDYVNIPAHVKHRVDWTDDDQETVWLAVHYD